MTTTDTAERRLFDAPGAPWMAARAGCTPVRCRLPDGREYWSIPPGATALMDAVRALALLPSSLG